MLIGMDRRFVFVANTKTASSAIEQTLMPHAEIHHGSTPARKHVGLHAALAEYGDLFARPGHAPETYFKFGVIRDPIDWICSWYRYRKGNAVAAPLPAGMSFAEFWARGDWNIIRRDGRRHLQRDCFTAPDGTLLADAILPYHDLEARLAPLLAAFGVQVPLPRRNVSNLRDLDAPLPEDLRAEMRAFYDADYALIDRLEEINAQGMETLNTTHLPEARVADRKPQL